MASLLIIVPSRSRPASIVRLLEAWTETGAWTHADLHVEVDQDDPTLDGYLAIPPMPGLTVNVADIWRPLVPKLNRVAEWAADRYEAVGFAGDDHVPRTPGWAGTYLDTLREMGTGIVYGDDGYQHENLPTEWAMTSDIIRALGRMVPAQVDHLYCDEAVRDLGRRAECIRYLPDVHIEHMHPAAKKADNDAQYKRVNSSEQYRNDGAAFKRWKKTGLAADVAKVKALRGAPVAKAKPAEPAPPKVSVIVPWRPTQDREVLWTFLHNQWVTSFPDWQIIEGWCPDGPWCKAAAVSDGLLQADGDVLVIADADVWCDGVSEAVQKVHDGAAWAIPHYLTRRLTRPATAEVLNSGQWPTRRTATTYAERPYPGRPGGGMVVLSRKTYEQVPMDPRFLGWGQEDESWALALGTILGRSWRGTADLWHLWHDPQVRLSRTTGSTANLVLHRRYLKAHRHASNMRALVGEFV